jgi:molecular chaperone GrpE (heat shock protein)
VLNAFSKIVINLTLLRKYTLALVQLWQILFPSKQPIANDHNDRLLSLESETQSLRLTINEREQTIAQLRSELERQRQNESNNQAIAFQTQQEQVFSELAAPISQLLTQIYLLEIENKPVQAKDAIAIVKRMLRVFTEQGLTQLGNIGEVVDFDPNLHQPLSSAVEINNGQAVKIRVAGLTYQGRVLRAAGVELCQDEEVK